MTANGERKNSMGPILARWESQRIWRVPGFPHPLFPDQEVELRVGAAEPYSVDEFMDGLPALALEVHTPVRSTQGGSGDPVTAEQLRTILSFINPTFDEEYARWVGIAKALWCGQIFVIGEAPDWMSLTDDWCSGRLWRERTGETKFQPSTYRGLDHIAGELGSGRQDGELIGLGTLIHLAQENGYAHQRFE